MSRDRLHLPARPQPERPQEKAPAPPRQSDSVLKAGFRAAGLCRTKNGWASAIVEIAADGTLVSVKLGPSQAFPDPVAGAVVKTQMLLNQETLKSNPWRP